MDLHEKDLEIVPADHICRGKFKCKFDTSFDAVTARPQVRNDGSSNIAP